MSLLRFPCGRCGTQTLCLHQGSGARKVIGRSVGAQLTPDTMIPLMLQSEGVWKHIESFIPLVVRTKDLDGHRERSNGEGQKNERRKSRSQFKTGASRWWCLSWKAVSRAAICFKRGGCWFQQVCLDSSYEKLVLHLWTISPFFLLAKK